MMANIPQPTAGSATPVEDVMREKVWEEACRSEPLSSTLTVGPDFESVLAVRGVNSERQHAP